MSASGSRRRGEAFGSVIAATGYDAVRPGYPPTAVSWLLGEPASPLRVLDLGAGTGKLTRTLVGHGHQVVAVDPAEAMLRALSAAVPGVETRVGRGEAVPLPDGDVDAVVIGQAWHWMDPDAAGAQIRRVLRPGGTVGLLWNVPDLHRGWVAELERLTTRDGDGGPSMSTAGVESPHVPAAFGDPWHRAFDNPHTLLREDFVTLVGTWSRVATHPRRDDVLGTVAALLDRVHGRSPSITLPQTCHCYRYEIA